MVHHSWYQRTRVGCDDMTATLPGRSTMLTGEVEILDETEQVERKFLSGDSYRRLSIGD